MDPEQRVQAITPWDWRGGLRAKGAPWTLVRQPEGSDLDFAEACHGMLRGCLDRLIKAHAFRNMGALPAGGHCW
jgi:hypothetical protein